MNIQNLSSVAISLKPYGFFNWSDKINNKFCSLKLNKYIYKLSSIKTTFIVVTNSME